MIMVSNPGDPALQVSWLAHAPWDGLTLADLVFPFFLFSTGISLTFMLRGKAEPKGAPRLYGRLFRRSGILAILGLLFQLFVCPSLSNFRIPGVLQRIGVCSLLGGLLLLGFSWRGVAWTLVGLLGGYAAILLWVPAPAFLAFPVGGASRPTEVSFAGASSAARPGPLSREGSLPSYVDRKVFGRHLYRPEYDPEGLLSTLSSVSTVLLGILAGFWLSWPGSGKARLGGLFGGGLLLAGAGGLGSLVLPVNKALWTPPFALLTGGISCVLLAGLSALAKGKTRAAGFKVLEIFGANAFAAYIASNFLTLLMGSLTLGEKSLEDWVFQGAVLPGFGGGSACLVYSLLHVLIWIPALWVLYRRKVFLRI
jgi:predicted acyltransferase